jgi:hypothetical protein
MRHRPGDYVEGVTATGARRAVRFTEGARVARVRSTWLGSQSLGTPIFKGANSKRISAFSVFGPQDSVDVAERLGCSGGSAKLSKP